MENFVRHWASAPRRFPSWLQISGIGYFQAKDSLVERAFESCNLSLILSGSGFYEQGGKRWEISNPTVLLQWPDEPLRYGPGREGETWEELYFIYPPECFERLKSTNLFNPDIPVRPLVNPAGVRKVLPVLETFCRESNPALHVDMFDRYCERVLLESAIKLEERAKGGAWDKIRHEIEIRFSEPINLDELASRHGLSASGFRRLWAAHVEMPPWQYILSLRVREACRLLAETSLQVQQVAERVGFEDPLYFSKRFQQATGYSPRDYRRRNELMQTVPVMDM